MDTINRTYRNIDIAISQQSDDITKLTSRMSKLKLKRSKDSPVSGSRDSRSSEESHFLAVTKEDKRGPMNVTPSIAVTTAAALNAERAAQRLKRALMTARKEPLLNTQAAEAIASATFEFKTPSKADLAKYLESATSSPAFGLGDTTPGGLLDMPKWNMPSFELPEHDVDSPDSPTPLHSHAHRLQKSDKKAGSHLPSIKLNRSPGNVAASPPVPSGFSWGPLPSLPSPTPSRKGGPLVSLPFSLKPKVEPQED